MEFEELLKKLWGFDAEIFAHDSLFVFINYITREEKIFHNCPGNDIQEWLDKTKPILTGFDNTRRTLFASHSPSPCLCR